MDQTADYVGKAKIFWNGRSQAVRLPAPCRFHVGEVEVVKRGDTVTLRPLGKDWASYFKSREFVSLPPRVQPPLQEREGWD